MATTDEEDETGRQLCSEREAGGTDGLAEHGERPEPPTL